MNASNVEIKEISNGVILPNFLIAGSAKCGTSSLHVHLAQHPEIFMSKRKEPRFFSSQFMSFPLGGPKDYRVEKWCVKNFDQYKALFENASGFKAVGESSADTLYFYKHTIPLIKQYLGDPKIILILRDPVKRAFSAYQHLVRDGRESLPFEDALLAEPERIKANYELIYHYRSVSHYYDPVKAFKDSFTDVKVILNEELAKNTHATLQEIFEFLDVSSDYVVQDTATRYNVSGKPRSAWLHEFLWEGHPLRNFIRPLVRAVIPAKKRQEIGRKILEKNLVKMTLDPATAKALKDEFREETLKLQSLIDKDLSKWL